MVEKVHKITPETEKDCTRLLSFRCRFVAAGTSNQHTPSHPAGQRPNHHQAPSLPLPFGALFFPRTAALATAASNLAKHFAPAPLLVAIDASRRWALRFPAPHRLTLVASEPGSSLRFFFFFCCQLDCGPSVHLAGTCPAAKVAFGRGPRTAQAGSQLTPPPPLHWVGAGCCCSLCHPNPNNK